MRLSGTHWIAVALLGVGASSCGSCLNPHGAAYPCEWDSGASASQCTAGWRCGLSGRCHPTGPDAGAPYACQSDSDCEAGWRCDAFGVCRDAAPELLSATQYEGPLTSQLLNPHTLSAPPLLFTRMLSPSGATYVSLIDGGILDEVAVSTNGSGVTTRTETRFTVGPASALAARNGRAYLAVPGGVEAVLPDGGTWFLPLDGVQGLRFAAPGVAILVPDAGFVHVNDSPPASVVTLPGGCAAEPIVDLTVVAAHPANLSSFDACLLAASPSGLFFENFGAGGVLIPPSDAGADAGPFAFAPVPAGSAFAPACGTPLSPRILQLFPGSEGLGIALRDPDGGYEAGLVAYDGLSVDAGLGASCSPDAPCCGRLGSLVFACPVCGASQLAEVRPIAASPVPYVLLRCVDPAGVSSWFSLTLSGSKCGDPFPQFEGAGLFLDQVAYNAAYPADLPYAGAHGGLWSGGAGRFDQAPFVLAGRPALVVEPDAGLWVVSDANELDPVTGGVVSLQDLWSVSPLGLSRFTARTGGQELGGIMGGRPNWIVLQNLNVKDTDAPLGSDVLAVGSFNAVTAPFNEGSLVPTPGGGFTLVVTVFDTLLAADISARLDGGNVPGILLPRSVPVPGNEVEQMAFYPLDDAGQVLAPDGEPLLMRGYVVTQGGLVELVVRNPVDWRATPISVPNSTPISVWRDGNRFRVGLADGTVDSLPSLVPLSPPIPELLPEVTFYGAVCGQAYALGANGLYRLAAIPGTGTGQWIPEPSDGGTLFPDGTSPSGGFIRSLQTHAYVATKYGGLVRLDPAGGGCP